MVPVSSITIRGAREHNLKNITVSLPRNQFIVITGVSGSGKSTLAFDTLFAEGQRRYVESLSAYARQFLEQMDKPDVDSIEGLSPAIAIEQKTASKNPRSTVGTVTEIHDYLRLLFASIGHPHCPDCNKPINPQTAESIVDHLMGLSEGARVVLLAPLVQGKKGEHRAVFKQMIREGFIRARVDGAMVEAENPPELDKKRKHTIEVVIDRIVIKSDVRTRLTDSVETALRVGKGVLLAQLEDREEVLSEHHACPECGFSFGEISPRSFSFNSPYGACPTCNGLGVLREIDVSVLIPDGSFSIRDGAVTLWDPDSNHWRQHQVEQVMAHYKIPIKTPWKDIPETVRNVILHGGDEEMAFLYQGDRGRYEYTGTYEGIIPMLKRRYMETESFAVRQDIEQFMTLLPCHDCQGTRLKREALAVRIGGRSIAEISGESVERALDFFTDLSLSQKERTIAEKILKEVRERLSFLVNVGLGYLTLDRGSASLSGGESQRIRLATQIGSRLTGVIYVLDEPSIGLHQRDNARLLDTLKNLRDIGNTVVVVEHDEETIESADYIVDLGPGAGIHGGEVVATGGPEEIRACPDSLTGQYLSGTKSIPIPKKRRPGNGKEIVLRGAREHNLKNIDVTFPLGTFTVVTGVSGSGKSTMVQDILFRAIMRNMYRSPMQPGEHDSLEGLAAIERVIDIDQSPIGRTPRSNPATYTGCLTPIREMLAKVPEARMRGYQARRFSFNVKGGRCETCQGGGTIKIEMHFLPDVYVTCDACHGRRFNRETLEIRYKGLNIAEILDLTVDQAYEIFEPIPTAKRILKTLKAVGLGYIRLGQPATTLSGGEAQRIKLSRELAKRPKGHTLYLLDEPTVGLHADDVRKLLQVLHTLVDRGSTVLVIEHNLDVIKTADHIIDLGPGGGDRGGKIVARGTPEEVMASKHSHTGHYLKKILIPS
ncbi:MAG TPA: excinuclease ABC subunit UvrA [Thermoanaerobaculia bacterium]|nr:excinuclease ABC subunit UvrA [Thermoanaerobaculia bacterium]HUM30628.1 excinuclease ABC subunit UvrA [Thermoanaerobaculia bacterium]HXK68844.1 excinuclease ABC subunit UvrA [Thermoanaerobaculia bacterium]